jgi:cation transport ATPase
MFKFSGAVRGRLIWQSAPLLWALTLAALAAGGVARLAGSGGAADMTWLAAAGCGLGYAAWSAADSFRRGRVGVDVIALLAVAGAAVIGELFAAAVISVMLTSGRALEAWAGHRARHDLSALLARAPRTGRHYAGRLVEQVLLDEIAVGDLLLVAAGEVIAVDGTLAPSSAVLDESALTGEPLPVEHRQGDLIRSGTLNVAGPFDLRASTNAVGSTYAGIVRLV